MIIAIDETGDFNEKSRSFHFFCGIHIRQKIELYDRKNEQFFEWENSLPKSLKNHKGEIKSSVLEENELSSFVEQVLLSKPYIRITPLRFLPIENPPYLIKKTKIIQLTGINDGVLIFAKQGKKQLAHTYKQFANWFRKLSYQQYIKIILLGNCIVLSLVNSIGTAIAQGFDDELTDLKFIIDKDFIKGREQSTFWYELLRNQLYAYSQKDLIPLPIEWLNDGHPFLEKYAKDGHINLNKLFWRNCHFVSSHKNFEIRIADGVNTILSRNFNNKNCKIIYKRMKNCFMKDKKITHITLNDFDLNTQIGIQEPNPWEILGRNINGGAT